MENFEKKALKILHHSKEEEYHSALAQCDYFRIKKGLHTNEIILEDYATQVFYRHKLKQLAKYLSLYTENCEKEFSGCSKVQAQIIINVNKKVENICQNEKDTEELNTIMGELLDIFVPLVDMDKHNEVSEVVEFTKEEMQTIKKNVALLNNMEHAEQKDL